MTRENDALRREFPPCSLLYVEKHHPYATSAAKKYNNKRSTIDPNDPASIKVAREAKLNLLLAIAKEKRTRKKSRLTPKVRGSLPQKIQR
jgi:hypothetical protein